MFQRTKICSGLLIAFGGLAALAPAAFAQDDQSVQRVEITGSSIKRIDAETAVPVTVIKADDLKKQGITTVDQILQVISSVQVSIGTSQVVGAGTGGASFADVRGIGANKTLVLLNGRRIANNAFDSSAPDMNMIPFAAIERVEVLRDGASSLYGTDAIGGVINFITRKDYRGGTITLGFDNPIHPGGNAHNGNIGFGLGDLQKDGVNVFGFVDFNKQDAIGGTQRPFNTRIPGGLSPTPFPANYYQDGDSGNPAAPGGCTLPHLTPDTDSPLDCFETTSSFVNYTPSSERISALAHASFKLGEDHTAGLEGFMSQNTTHSVIAPVPYGGLFMNRLRPDGTPNPYYPGNPGSGFTPNIPLSPTYTEDGITDDPSTGILPGFIHVKWRDLDNGSREGIDVNEQYRVTGYLEGRIGEWDYNTAIALNHNSVKDSLAGYSNGDIISQGMLDGVINPFGEQDAAGAALIQSAGVAGLLQTATGTVQSIDGHASRDLQDWFGAGRPAAVAFGGEARHEVFQQRANTPFAEQVVSSTGIDPNTYNAGWRNVYAAFFELNIPVIKSLDFTVAARYDNYSDFGSTTNPKFSFRWQPNKVVLLRGSYSTGFRAPSLYELNSAPAFTNTDQQDDPVNCPGGVPAPGKPSAANCNQQFQTLFGGNKELKPEKSKNATLGIVLEPLKDFTAEADLFMVKFKNQIGAVDTDTIFADPVTYASLFHRNPAGNLSTDGSSCPGPNCGYIDQRTVNLGGIDTNGIDFAFGYRTNVGSYGKMNFGLQSTWIHKYEYQNIDGAPWLNELGVFTNGGPIFRWQHNAEINWNLEPFSVGVAGHYKTGYLDEDPTRRVSDYATFDLFGTYAMQKGFSVTLGLRNIFDRDPPFSNQTTVFQAGYDPRFTDPTGRTFYARGTYSF
jgi:iron complex outermembrane receptor protein